MNNSWIKLVLFTLLVIFILGLMQGVSGFIIPSSSFSGAMNSGLSGNSMVPIYWVMPFILSLLSLIFIGLFFIGIFGFLFSVSVSNEFVNNNQIKPEISIRPNETLLDNINIESIEIVVRANNLTFEPKIIKVRKGSRVILTFRNEEDVLNNFVIDGMGVSTDYLSPNTEQTVEFTAETEGDYRMRSTTSNIPSRSGKFIVQ